MVRSRQAYGHGILGLKHEFGIDPLEFLNDVYRDLDRSRVKPNPPLRAQISALADRCTLRVLTNSTGEHARELLQILGLSSYFHAVHPIEEVGFQLKPSPHPYRYLLDEVGLTSSNTLVFDDSYRNLRTAADFGLRTCLVSNGGAPYPKFWEMHALEVHDPPEWVDAHTHNLASFIDWLHHPSPALEV